MTVTYEPTMGVVFWWPHDHCVAEGWCFAGCPSGSSWIIPGTYEE